MRLVFSIKPVKFTLRERINGLIRKRRNAEITFLIFIEVMTSKDCSYEDSNSHNCEESFHTCGVP
jgi:hypothetical protein